MAVQNRFSPSVDGAVPEYVELVLFLGLVWGVGDTLSTVLASHVTGSSAGELNPLLRTLLEIDPTAVIVLKGAVALYVCFVLLAARDQVTDVPGWRLWFLGMIAAGTLIVAQNLAVVFVTIH